MPMTTYTGATNIIAGLGNTPQERGLTTDQFKAKFDQFGTEFIAWLNTTHKTEFDTIAQKNKLDATIDPTITDDSNSGYAIKSLWVNITSDKAFICLDSTVGAAVWKEITVQTTDTTNGNYKYITSYTPSNVATIDIVFPANTKRVKIVYNSIIPVTNSVNIQVQLSNDGGSTFKNDANYMYAATFIDSSADTISPLRATGATSVVITPTTISSSAAGRQIVELEFYNTDQGSRPQFSYDVIGNKITSLDTITVKGTARYANAMQTNAVRLFFSSGNVSSAKVDVYAILV